MTQRLKATLKQFWGYDTFLHPQQEIIESLLNKKDTLALLPTGGGKSLCYQLPILTQNGIALVVSPLVALMKNQIATLKAKGIKAELLSSELSKEDISILFDNCLYGKIKLLYVSPERIQSLYFEEKIKQLPLQYIAIDEVHCVAEWGHDFRPSYLQLTKLREWFPELPFLAVTASATPQMQKEIQEQLDMKEAAVFKTSLFRKNLAYRTFYSENKWDDLIYYLKKHPGSSIVFCRTRKETYEVATFLKEKGFDSDYFHARLSQETKNKRQNEWIESNQAILCATNAFGMGIDKPNVRQIIHLHIPQSVEAYVQEVGRAGRDGEMAYGTLLYNESDAKNNNKRFKSSIPNKEQFMNIIHKLYNYFQIAENEKPTRLFGFSEHKFITQFDLPKRKTKFTIQFLQQQQWIKVHANQKMSLAKILIPNTNVNQTKGSAGLVLDYIARNYGGIFSDAQMIDEFYIGRKLQLSTKKVKTVLGNLSENNLVYYRDAAIIKLEFLQPRAENEIRNILWKKLVQIQQTKWNRLQDVHYLIENDTVCKSQLILKYFGEKSTQKCGICSVCAKEENSVKNVTEKEVYHFLESGEKSIGQILEHFIFSPKEKIIQLIQILVDEEKIKQLTPNKFTL